MNINAINPSLELLKSASQEPAVDNSRESFGAYLKNSFNEVNQMLATSDKKAAELSVGKSENLHDAMISFEKADTAFKLLVQVRNRAIEAYHEIMRMQV